MQDDDFYPERFVDTTIHSFNRRLFRSVLVVDFVFTFFSVFIMTGMLDFPPIPPIRFLLNLIIVLGIFSTYVKYEKRLLQFKKIGYLSIIGIVTNNLINGYVDTGRFLIEFHSPFNIIAFTVILLAIYSLIALKKSDFERLQTMSSFNHNRRLALFLFSYLLAISLGTDSPLYT